LEGSVTEISIHAQTGDLEIWVYKATRSNSYYLGDYVRQLLTYAALYEERTGKAPTRCVLFFINEPRTRKQLLAIPVDAAMIKNAVNWIVARAKLLRDTVLLSKRILPLSRAADLCSAAKLLARGQRMNYGNNVPPAAYVSTATSTGHIWDRRITQTSDWTTCKRTDVGEWRPLAISAPTGYLSSACNCHPSTREFADFLSPRRDDRWLASSAFAAIIPEHPC
jgi:hypothetical protein